MRDYASLVYRLGKCGFVDMPEFNQEIAEDCMFLMPEQDFQFSGLSGNYGLRT